MEVENPTNATKYSLLKRWSCREQNVLTTGFFFDLSLLVLCIVTIGWEMSYRLIKKEQRPGDVVSFKDIKMTKSMLKHSTAEYQRPQAHCKHNSPDKRHLIHRDSIDACFQSVSVFSYSIKFIFLLQCLHLSDETLSDYEHILISVKVDFSILKIYSISILSIV